MSQVKRRLAAILCADAVQYSRLMEADEDGTLDRLRACREAIAGLVAARDGRIVNTWGDAVIVEFASVIEAVRCAAEIQDDLARHNEALPEAERMAFRIGLNLGDVMVEGDDIYGDGVNIAARLQQMAEPGGIVISGTVHDQVKSKLSMGFEPLGAHSVKNISDPVETWRIRIGGENAARAARGPASPPPGPASSSDMQEPRPLGQAVHAALGWYRAQSRRVQTAVGGIAFFFILNMLTGPGTLWFQWPSLPFLAMILFGGLRRKER
ncbi:adenylate/guanylate cyclase domain-containing protein [Stappia sp. MMSF_3263]|uniref:adenylate/guanylate cyclase domain-containing protein n=1 Tax=Stappia sp. MMSF_3263 TaxID=3046693 RepID=UPI0027401E7E|nr:adenylate/guanylate cyclase domain-containing protein [Stappia sp. MMSF_3263]